MKTIEINGIEYPTYATVEEADDYFNASFGASWEEINDYDKEKLLISATRSIDKGEYRGQKVEESQLLEFPRIINGKETSETILMKACCEEAQAIYDKGTSATADIDGVKRVEVQDTAIEFKDSSETSEFVSDVTDDLLRPYRYLGVSVLYWE